MSSNRRDFLKSSAAAVALTLAAPTRVLAETARNPARWAEPAADDLMAEALNAAKDAGATYADVRIGRYRRQGISTRERQITGVTDGESYGMGIRTIVNGAWGFAATSNMTKEGVAKAAREAARLSRAAPLRAEAAGRARADARRQRHVENARRRAIRSTCRSRRKSRCCSRRTKRRSRCRGCAS